MPANALPPPMPCDVVEGCPLNGPCYSRVNELPSLDQPSTSLMHRHLAFLADDFFQDVYRGSEFEYYVNDFPKCQELYIESDPFCDGAGGTRHVDESTTDLKWRLKVYPRATGKDGKQYVGVFLRLHKCRRKQIMASFRISWLGEDEVVLHFVETPRPCLFYEGKDLGYAHFIERNAVLETMQDYCEETYSDDEGPSGSGDGALRLMCQVKIDSATEVPDLKTMGRCVYECGKEGRSLREPVLYIM